MQNTVKKYIKDIRDSFDSVNSTGFEVMYNYQNRHYGLKTAKVKFPAFKIEEIDALKIAIKYLVKHKGATFEKLKSIEEKLGDRKVKTYSVNQIESAEIRSLRKNEEKLVSKDLEIGMEHMWDWADEGAESVAVRIKFHSSIGERIKKKLKYRKEHFTQKIEDTCEGVIVSFKIKKPENMIPWLLQYGANAEVLEPDKLRKKMKFEIQQLNKLY